MDGSLPETVLAFIKSANSLGLSLNWNISSLQEKRSVLLEWIDQPKKYSRGEASQNHKSPSRRRRDNKRYQAWIKKQKTSETRNCSQKEGNNQQNRQVQDSECNRPTETQRKHPKKLHRHTPETLGPACLPDQQNFPPAVCTVSPDCKLSTCETPTQTDKQVTISHQTQTSKCSKNSQRVQTTCSSVQSEDKSAQTEFLSQTNSVPTQTWTLTGNQSTQTVGNGSQETKLLLHPWCLEPSGLEFPDQKFIDSLIRTKKDPERLPTLRKTGQRNVCDKSITMKVSYGQQTYERHLLASSFIAHDIDHVTSCVTWNGKGVAVQPYFGESYLLTKCRGQHFILPDSACYSDFKQLDRAGSLCVTLIIYDHERGRYAPAEPQDGEGVRSQNAQ